MNRRRGQDVILNIYDLHSVNDYMWSFGVGVYHSGVEINGVEYSFASGAGVFDMTPKDAPGATFREAVHMGEFFGSSNDVKEVIRSLSSEFPGESYNLVTRNCNTFADVLCQRLLNKPIPSYVNRLAYFGSYFAACLPPELTNAAPVDEGGSGGGQYGGQSSGGGGSYSATNAYSRPSVSAFSGKGVSLSGSANATGGGAASAAELRAARLAALQGGNGGANT